MGMQRNRKIRQEEAKVRNEARAALTDEQQLARLDTILGKGVGAKSERARLADRIAGNSNKGKSKKK
tara:strand:+ start:2529 stop:2729 length:201 start_codon:yes stop_codon:yes gene_type:complete